ncbi:hypothetical protein BKA70DRAFT_1214040 [Coprinopsis sp. MPI-PUGE-AT-0042]|nr:hypothetical protein BKA70DRAFT_1214040 [Coprinopsis sp. MPI-PUGE-AT-0042]
MPEAYVEDFDSESEGADGDADMTVGLKQCALSPELPQSVNRGRDWEEEEEEEEEGDIVKDELDDDEDVSAANDSPKAVLSGGRVVTKEEEDVEDIFRRHSNDIAFSGFFDPPPKNYKVLDAISDYTSERAIDASAKMLQHIRKILKLTNIKLATKALAQRLSATGVGKSSLLNALLDGSYKRTPVVTRHLTTLKDRIVPTSSMRGELGFSIHSSEADALSRMLACTSVVTEIKYHDDQDIVADVHFLDRADWEQEVAMIIDELTGDGENTVKKPADLHSSAGIAWRKPILADNLDSEVSSLLGSCKRVRANDSEEFRKEIAKFIDAGPTNGSKQGIGVTELWPLISKVTIRCNAKVLDNGATFVDLPGVDDSNAARNSIAEEFMKKATHIWILASIHRAVSDKTAHHLLGESFNLQLLLAPKGFRATMNARWTNSNNDQSSYDKQSITFIATKCDQLVASEVEHELNLYDDPERKEIQSRIDEDKRMSKMSVTEQFATQLSALENDKAKLLQRLEAFRGYASGSSQSFLESSDSRKRKLGESATLRASKRSHLEGSGSEPNSDTEEGLMRQLEKVRQDMEATQMRLLDAIRNPKPRRDPAIAEREKMGYCSLKRSEASRLTAAFLAVGTSPLEERLQSVSLKPMIPKASTPASSQEADYEEVNLPVFTCSSQDYIRIICKDQNDGPPTCFSDVKHTGIPAVRKWCRMITLARHERATRDFLAQLSAFVKSIQGFARITEGTSAADQETLRRQWDTQTTTSGGVTRRLHSKFQAEIDQLVASLETGFRHGLAERCASGAQKAMIAAPVTLQEFTKPMHWSTYRALLRRRGKYKDFNLNLEFTKPLSLTIAQSWTSLFGSKHLEKVDSSVANHVLDVLQDLVNSAPPGMKQRAKRLAEACYGIAQELLPCTIQAAADVLMERRRELSHGLSSHVKDGLRPGYTAAMLYKGKGSGTGQKKFMADFVDGHKRSIFETARDDILGEVKAVPPAVGQALKKPLQDLAFQMEINASVLWESTRKDAPQRAVRDFLLRSSDEIQQQVTLWTEAARGNIVGNPSSGSCPSIWHGEAIRNSSWFGLGTRRANLTFTWRGAIDLALIWAGVIAS